MFEIAWARFESVLRPGRFCRPALAQCRQCLSIIARRDKRDLLAEEEGAHALIDTDRVPPKVRSSFVVDLLAVKYAMHASVCGS